MRCAFHPGTETELTCGRCDTPVCPRCLIHTEVGIRCPKCCQQSHKPHMLLAALLGFGVVGLLVSLVAVPPLLHLKPQAPSSASPAESTLAPIAVGIASPRPPPTPAYDLVITGSSCLIGQHSTKCSGTVRNVSGRNLKGVQVVIAMGTADGGAQTSDAGPIDYDPLLPDQESPWTLYPSFNPAFTQYWVTFRSASGQPLFSRKETP